MVMTGADSAAVDRGLRNSCRRTRNIFVFAWRLKFARSYTWLNMAHVYTFTAGELCRCLRCPENCIGQHEASNHD